MTLRPRRAVLGALILGGVSVGLGGCGASSPAGPAGSPSTPTTSSSARAPTCARGRAFVVVRHAEKASADKDPPLTERGRARAERLAAMLASTGVTRLVASPYRRTHDTLAPLGERLSLPVETGPTDRPAAIVPELESSPDGSITVVASHSNVIPTIVRELAGVKLRGVEGDSLADDDYSRVIVITVPCARSGEPARPYVVELASSAE